MLTNLVPNTEYRLDLYDYIGNSISHSFTTPIDVGTTSLRTISLSLPTETGKPSGPQFPILTLCAGEKSKLLLSPTLSTGESITLSLSTIITNTNNTQGDSFIFKKCGINGTFDVLNLATGRNVGTTNLSPIILNQNDCVCISSSVMSVNQNNNSIANGSAKVILNSAISSTINPIITNNLTTVCLDYIPSTTTTTTTLTPIENISVYFEKTSQTILSDSIIYDYIVRTSQPLLSNQTFTLNVGISLSLSLTSNSDIPAPLTAEVEIGQETGDNYSLDPIIISRTINRFTNLSYQENRNTRYNSSLQTDNVFTTYRVKVNRDSRNNNNTHIANATINIISITNPINGNYILDNSKKSISATLRHVDRGGSVID